MEKFENLRNSIQRIHEEALRILKRQGLDRKTRDGVAKIAEETLELIQQIGDLDISSDDCSDEITTKRRVVDRILDFLTRIVPMIWKMTNEN